MKINELHFLIIFVKIKPNSNLLPPRQNELTNRARVHKADENETNFHHILGYLFNYYFVENRLGSSN